jgi:hypothetical protein
VKVSFTPDAKQSVRDKRAWWVKHRDKAPRLFRDELRAVVAKIRSGEDEGKQEYTVLRGRVIWRLLMPKTKNYVYYRAIGADEVELLLVWNAISGTQPDFSSL